MKKKLRPKGCNMTISGRHVPSEKTLAYTISFFCQACGKIDDTGAFHEYLYGKPKKIDDSSL